MKARPVISLLILWVILSACVKNQIPPIPIEPSTQSSPFTEEPELQNQETSSPAINVVCPIYYREEFGGTETSSCWQPSRPLIVVGFDRDKVTSGLTASGLRLEVDATNTYAYIAYPGNLYTDVVISAEVTSTGVNNHAAVLTCRMTDEGWYEARVSTAGYFSVFRYEYARDKSGRNPYYDYVLDRPSSAIDMGSEKTNSIQLACIGDSLILSINGSEVFNRKVATDFTEPGLIGIGALSFDKVPVTLIFDGITISQP